MFTKTYEVAEVEIERITDHHLAYGHGGVAGESAPKYLTGLLGAPVQLNQ